MRLNFSYSLSDWFNIWWSIYFEIDQLAGSSHGVKGVSTISNICLVWKWIEEKFDIKWMYLLCFIFVDTAFLLCGAELINGGE